MTSHICSGCLKPNPSVDPEKYHGMCPRCVEIAMYNDDFRREAVARNKEPKVLDQSYLKGKVDAYKQCLKLLKGLNSRDSIQEIIDEDMMVAYKNLNQGPSAPREGSTTN